MAKHPYAARPKAATHTWLTPLEILQPLGAFDLDPCAAPSPRPWPTAARHIELPEDGLAATWQGRVWLNPPFGNHTGPWLRKMVEHGNGIALTFARTDTAFFHDWVWPNASALLFLRSRPHFRHIDGSRAEGNCGGPIVLSAFGDENARVLSACGLSGTVIYPTKAAA